MPGPHPPRLSLPAVLLLAGPTASGKSTLALELARAGGGEIVNADSMQVYRDLAILTARPEPEQEAAAPHHLFGVADAAEAWSAGRWMRAAAEVLAGIAARGRPAIVVGGTGLYFTALTRGLADTPVVPASIRREVGALFEAEGEAAFRTRLIAVDPAAAARISPGDRQRLSRALEVWMAGGVALSDLRAATQPLLAPDAWRGVVLSPPRTTLFARCDARLAAMLERGALREVAALAARGLADDLPILKALGVAPLRACVAGKLSAAEALAVAQRDTRRYAKRQITWLRHQAAAWPRIEALDLAGQTRQLAALIDQWGARQP